MTPPSTLRLSGIAATLIALTLMGANRGESGAARHPTSRHEGHEARVVYAAVPRPAPAPEIRVAALKAELEATVAAAAKAEALAMVYDSVARAFQLKVAPAAR
jgi:hypothetical protein